MLRSVCTNEQKKSLEEDHSLNKSENHRKLFGQLDSFWDYLSYDPLALLIKELSLQNTSFMPIQEEITVYQKHLQEFRMHTTLASFCQATPHEEYDPPEVFWKMVNEYQWHETVTLEDIEMFRKHYGLSNKLQTLAMIVNSIMSNNETRTETSEVRQLKNFTHFQRVFNKCDGNFIMCYHFCN